VREGTQVGGVGEGEAGFPRSREPNAGLDPRTLGSRPEPKADAERPSHPGAPAVVLLKITSAWSPLETSGSSVFVFDFFFPPVLAPDHMVLGTLNTLSFLQYILL